MHRVRPRQPIRTQRVRLARLPLAAAICLAVAPSAFAQDNSQQNQNQNQTPAAEPAAASKPKTLGTVTVTAQKREENLQKVPISIDVLGGEQLQELHVKSFDDYVKYLPSVSYQTFGPGFALIYMRGVASGGDGNHSGSLPSVGVYLDEQPVTTIQGPLDIHMYDIARVESLSGPQGTLYGASAEAGALRIITNKPDPSAFAASYSVGMDSVDHGGIGYEADGMVNIPLSPSTAIRLVGWHEHDAGYIDNVVGERTFPTSGITVSNAKGCSAPDLVCTGAAKKNYNDVDTSGARAALKINLNDEWSISPTLMGQQTIANGNVASDPQVGSLALTHFYPEKTNDRWIQAALTVEGKIGNFDLTYAYGRLKRNQEEYSDYSDYSFWYDTLAGYGAYIYDNSGKLINPSQFIQGKDHYTMNSHELRIASPKEDRLRVVGGLFWEKQVHDIEQAYMINGLADSLAVPGWPNTLWLTEQQRNDRDKAVFGELSYDFIPETLTGTIGGRYFKTDNSLQGFYGFSSGYSPSSSYGEAGCVTQEPYHGAPCSDFFKSTNESGSLGKANLTWQITPEQMIYGTWSEGFRPGGINRRGSLPPYKSDYLTNYELGWKTTWFDNRLSFNGAVFREKWKDFQFSILGANGLTEIKNAGQAQIDGLESDLNWAATYNLTIGMGIALYNAKLTENYCGFTDTSGTPITYCPAGTVNPLTGDVVTGPQAPKGTQLPVTPKFKGNLIARYAFDVAGMEAFVQGAVVHVGERTSDLRILERGLVGNLPAYTTVDFTAGIKKHGLSLDIYINNMFDKRGQLYRYTECAEAVCAAHDVVPAYPNGQVYTVMTPPRTIGIRLSQEF
ncbi:TonB-dependent receptor [Dyella japonica]|uniref:TonB-dependent receptor n=1 Tax=Dyella japonica DSM 16301 TaxID=1440762 RepID=A0A0G9H544_9GAMM|nr:TonB-dependent receptor [Dyella japonica]KLD64955.1 TonB-dependent receptor [Dyella japonica DSM 16301]